MASGRSGSQTPPRPGRRTFLGLALALAAALAARLLPRAPAVPRPDGGSGARGDAAPPEGWREARHWRKI